MLNIRLVLNLRNIFDKIEIALDEADLEATNNIKRLTREDVFSKIMKKINSAKVKSIQ